MTTGMPLTSVILTSFNYDRYVGQAIDSVFEQTYRPIELIIVDDGSRDRSVQVIEEKIRSSPIPVRFFQQENRGQAAAWNRAYREVRGQVVSFLDSDDYWLESKLEEMVRLMTLCPHGGVYQHQLENEEGKAKQRYLGSGDFFQDWKSRGRINLAIHQGMISPCVPSSGLVFWKEVLDRVFPVPEKLVTCPDAFLTRTAPAFGPILSHPATLGFWREHEENAGKRDIYGYREFWIPVIMPILNRWYREHQIPIELYYRERGLIREAFRHLAEDPGRFGYYFRNWLRKKFSKSR